jgi:hypothetical protein
MNDLAPLFPTIEPPAGGIRGLRVRLERDRRRRARARLAGAALAGTALALVVGLLVTPAPPPAPALDRVDDSAIPALVSLGLRPAPSEPAEIPPQQRNRMALLRVPTKDPRVIFYRLVALEDPEPETPATN